MVSTPRCALPFPATTTLVMGVRALWDWMFAQRGNQPQIEFWTELARREMLMEEDDCLSITKIRGTDPYHLQIPS
jgi:hypothetical protein